jgi:hypothetical protein
MRCELSWSVNQSRSRTARRRRGWSRAAVRNGLKGHQEELEAAVESAFGKVIDSLANRLVVTDDVSAEQAARILEGLEERGRSSAVPRVHEMAEQKPTSACKR